MKRISLSFFVSAVFFLISLIWLKLAYMLPFKANVSSFGGPGTFPFIVLCIMVAGSFIVTAGELLKMLRNGDGKPLAQTRDYLRVAALLATAVAYVILIEFAGYLPSTILLLFAALLLFGERNKLVLAGVSILFPSAIYLLFKVILEVQLP